MLLWLRMLARCVDVMRVAVMGMRVVMMMRTSTTMWLSLGRRHPRLRRRHRRRQHRLDPHRHRRCHLQLKPRRLCLRAAMTPLLATRPCQQSLPVETCRGRNQRNQLQ